MAMTPLSAPALNLCLDTRDSQLLKKSSHLSTHPSSTPQEDDLRSPMDKEEFAYPTNLESAPLYLDDEVDNPYQGYEQGHTIATAKPSGSWVHPESLDQHHVRHSHSPHKDYYTKPAEFLSELEDHDRGHFRANNPSSGSDLVQVTVEDLLISEEQVRTVKANVDQYRQDRNYHKLLLQRQDMEQDEEEADKGRHAKAEDGQVDRKSHGNAAVQMVEKDTEEKDSGSKEQPMQELLRQQDQSSSRVERHVQRDLSTQPASSQGYPFKTLTITATITTINDNSRSISFEETFHVPEQQNDGLSLQKPKEPLALPPPESTPSIVAAATTVSQPKIEPQQLQDKAPSGNSQIPAPTKALTPAQQREAEADAHIQKAIELHENNELEEATRHFYLAAQSENPLGQLMYGLSLRHGWGCKANPNEAIVYLQRAAEFAMGELKELNPAPVHAGLSETATLHPAITSSQHKQRTKKALEAQQQQQEKDQPSSEKERRGPTRAGGVVATGAALKRMGSLDRKAAMATARKELVMALYELGMSYLKGWGVTKDKAVAFTYFKIAADLGDADSQIETGLCYYDGIGIDKDMFQSAKYYRMAAAQGVTQLGNSWIWKPKYDQYCAAEEAASTIKSHRPTGSSATGPKSAPIPLTCTTAAGSLPLKTTPSSPSSLSSPTSFTIKAPSTSSSSRAGSPPVSPTTTSGTNATAVHTPQYTIAGIAAGFASVTAATAGAIIPPTFHHHSPSASSSRDHLPLSFNSTLTSSSNTSAPSSSSSSPSSRPQHRHHKSLVSAPILLPSSSSSSSSSLPSPLSSLSTTTTTTTTTPLGMSTEHEKAGNGHEKKKHRWSLWGGSKTNSSTTSLPTVSPPST